MTRRLLGAGLVAGVALMGVMWPGPALAASALPEGFVYLREVDPTIVQDIRYASAALTRYQRQPQPQPHGR
jgi:D-alanyl-D-alanine dipeptidase